MDSARPPLPLLPGERLLWQGRPHGGITFQASDILMIPFSLLWGGFALFWNAMVWWTDAPIFFRLWGVPFLIVGAYITIGRFFADAWIRRHLYYAVTDRRILIRRTILPSVRSLDIRRLPQLDLSERTDGSGTIGFDAGSPWLRGNGLHVFAPLIGAGMRFVRIAQVRQVYDLILRQTG